MKFNNILKKRELITNLMIFCTVLITFIFPISSLAMEESSLTINEENDRLHVLTKLPLHSSNPEDILEIHFPANWFFAVYGSLTAEQLKAELRFHRFTKGEVVYAYGTSTSGKSTFTNLLLRFLPEYALVSTRDLKTQYQAKIIREICPREYDYITKFLNTDILLLFLCGDDEIPAQIKVTKLGKKLEKIKSKKNLINRRYNSTEELHYIFDCVFMLSAQNQNVIVDNLDVLDFLGYINLYNIHCPLHMLLLYCPPNILLDRVLRRNELAIISDKGNRRSLMRPFQTFVDIFKNSTDKSFLDEIEQSTLLQTFYSAHSQSRAARDPNSLSRLDWNNILNILCSNFGTSSIIRLQSKYPYDVLLDTGNHTAEELATTIYEKIKR